LLGLACIYLVLDYFILEILLKWNVLLFLCGGGIWLPQIYRNASRIEVSAPPNPYYLLSMQAVLTFFILYMRLYPANILDNRPSPIFAYSVTTFSCLQLIFLSL